jgi:hypothetical protein
VFSSNSGYLIDDGLFSLCKCINKKFKLNKFAITNQTNRVIGCEKLRTAGWGYDVVYFIHFWSRSLDGFDFLFTVFF